MSNKIDLQTAILRIARAGIKQANAGDLAGGQALVKTANALAEGHNRQDILNAFFVPEVHQKVAAVLDDIVSRPSDVAQIVTMQKKAEAFDKLAAKKKNTKVAGISDYIPAINSTSGGIAGGVLGAGAGAGIGALTARQGNRKRNAIIGALLGGGIGSVGGAAGGHVLDPLKNTLSKEELAKLIEAAKAEPPGTIHNDFLARGEADPGALTGLSNTLPIKGLGKLINYLTD